MDKKAANILKYLLSVVLAAVLVWIAFRGVDWPDFWDGLRQTRGLYLVLYLVFALLALLFREERWRCILHTLDPQLGRLDIWDANNVGNLVNIVLPGAGEFTRCGYVSSKRLGYDKSLGTAAAERVCDVAAILVLLLLALVLEWGRIGSFFVERIWEPLALRLGGGAGWYAALLVLLLVSAICAAWRLRGKIPFFGKVARALQGIWTGFSSLARMERKGLFFIYTLAIWTMYVLMLWATVRAIPVLDHLGMADVLFLSAVGNFASVIPVPGGIGAYHYLVALSVQTLYGCSWESGILLATLGHELHAVLVLLLGIVSYLRLTLRKKK